MITLFNYFIINLLELQIYLNLQNLILFRHTPKIKKTW